MKNWSPAKQFNQKLIIECLTEVSTRVNAQMKNLNRIEELEFTAWRGSEERDHEYEMALINKELKAELHRRQKKIEHTILSVVLDKLQALVKINPEQNVNQISNSIKREITSLAYTCIRKYRDDYKYGEIDEKQSHLVRGINFEEIEANIIRAIENCQSPEALIDVERYQFPIEISNLKDIRNRLSLEHGLFDLCSKDPSARSFSQYAYGKYLVEHQIRVGQCGEFTAACIYLLIKESLPKFYKNMQRNDETRLHIEEIVVEYDDENHVFLAINRDPESDVHDFTTWGEEAILFDAWNRLITYVNDYTPANFKHCFESYHIEGKWTATNATESREIRYLNFEDELTESDKRSVLNIKDDKDYQSRVEKMLIIREINSETHQSLYSILLGYVNALKPKNLNTRIYFYYTELGNAPILSKQLENRVALIFNRQFLVDLANYKNFDLNDFQFALASELELIYAFPGKLNSTIPMDVNQHLDRKAGQMINLPTYGLNYIRKCQSFIKDHPFIIIRMRYRTIDLWEDDSLTQDGLNKRLQTLKTQFASGCENESLTMNAEIQTQRIPDALASALSHLVPIPSPYSINIERFDSIGEKLDYLTRQLHYLDADLVLREMDNSDLPDPINHFLKIVASLKPDLDEPTNQIHIARFLQHIKLNHHVYYDHFYYAIFGAENSYTLPALFPAYSHYKLFAKMLVNFLQSRTIRSAESLAKDIENYFQQYEYFYYREYHQPTHQARKYTTDFKAQHGRFPVGLERAAFSTLGYELAKRIDIGIDTIDHLLELIPDRSILNLNDHLIAKTLWKLGVNVNFKFWDKFTTEALRKLFILEDDKDTSLQLHLPGKLGLMSNKGSNHLDFNIILAMYIAENRAFVPPVAISLKDKFHAYYQQVIPWLILDLTRDHEFKVNADGSDVLYGLPKEQLAKLDTLRENSSHIIEKFIEIIDALIASVDADDQKQAFDFLYGNSEPSLGKIKRYDHHYCSYPVMSSNLFFRYMINQIKANKNPMVLEKTAEIFKYNTQSPLRDLKYSNVTVEDFYTLYQIENNDTIENFILLLDKLLNSQNQPFSEKLKTIFDFVQQFCDQNSISGYTPSALKIFNFIRNLNEIYPIDYSVVAKIITTLGVEPKTTWRKREQVAITDLIYRFHAYDFFMLFPTPNHRNQILNEIVERIKSLKDDNEIINTIEQLILKNDSPFSQPINDIDVFSECLAIWGKSLKSQHSVDDGSDAYYLKIKPKIFFLYKNTFKVDSRQLFQTFCDVILAQARVAFHIGKYEGHVNPAASTEQNGSLKNAGLSTLSEVMQFFSRRKENVDVILDFLCKPLTSEAVYIMADHIINTDQDIQFLQKQKLNSHGYSKLDKFSKRAQIALTVKKMYFQFWSSDITHRATVINYLLIPANKYSDDAAYHQAYLDAFTIIINRLFPTKPYSEDDEFAIALLKAYIDSANLFERGYILCAMIVAQQANAQKNASTVDKLITLCEHLGPAYIKFLQAIHSYPKTPARYKEKLAHAKGKAAMPTRWDLFDLISIALSKQERDQLGFVGKILGCASFNIAVEVVYRNKPAVLSMLRLNARQQARKGYQLLYRTIDACQHTLMEKYRHDARVMIQDAKHMSELETDFVKGDQQYAIAHAIYGVVAKKNVVIDQQVYSLVIKPCVNIRSGHDFRFLSVAAGCEFNALPTTSWQDQQIKHAVALRIVEIELLNLLKGNQFDCDRHGCQYRVSVDDAQKTITLGLYDFGLMSVARPSQDEIAQLGELMLSLLIDMTPVSVNERVEQFIQDKLDKKLDTSYLRSLRKAFLAMSDFLNELSFHDFMQLTRQILTSPDLHPMLRQVCLTAQSSWVVKTALMTDSVVSWVRSSSLGFFRANTAAEDAVASESSTEQLPIVVAQEVSGPQR